MCDNRDTWLSDRQTDTKRKMTKYHELAFQMTSWKGTVIASRWTLKISLKMLGLPCWFSGEDSTCQPRRYGLDPCSGKIPPSSEQLSLCAVTAEAVLQGLGATLLSPEAAATEAHTLEPMLCKKRPPRRGTPQSESSCGCPQQRKACKDPEEMNQSINQIIFKRCSMHTFTQQT